MSGVRSERCWFHTSSGGVALSLKCKGDGRVALARCGGRWAGMDLNDDWGHKEEDRVMISRKQMNSAER